MVAGTSTLLCVSLLTTPTSAAPSAALPWMCNCETDAEHCGSQVGQDTQKLCALMVELAQEVGFDPELPAGSPGSMLAMDPKAAHLIGDYCNIFRGVHCYEGKLWSLDWSSMELGGTFPLTLSKWPSVVQLSLHGNHLRGSIPKLDLPNLEDANLGNNSFSGGFPQVHLPSLWRMNLADNQLAGPLPHGIGESIPKLRRLWLDGNRFEGHIPFDIPFFNDSNLDARPSSIMCGFSGNAWSCPIEDYVKAGPNYDCEHNKPMECVPAEVVV